MANKMPLASPLSVPLQAVRHETALVVAKWMRILQNRYHSERYANYE